ncbi:hypothetical protein ACW73L_20660 [Methylolobus aquaticus]
MARTVTVLSGEGPEAASLPAFVTTITGRTCKSEADAAAEGLSAWLADIGRPGLPPVILLDEAEIFLRQFDYRFFERLRGMLGRLCLVIATHQPIDLLFEQIGRGSPFDNKLRIERLGLLEDDAAERLVRRGDGRLDPEDQHLMRDWAGRHPYYLQLLGFRLVEARLRGEARESALDRAREDAFARLRQLWRTLRDRERQALREAATGRPTDNHGLRTRGVLDHRGFPFGRVVPEWLTEEDEL